MVGNVRASSIIFKILSNNYFVYNNCIYKQVHGCAMGSPVSPIVANLCMEVVEELAINTSTVTPRIWKRYVDDSFVIIKKDAVSSFHDTLNSIDPNGQISFLDTLVSRKNGVTVIDVYRKPTHTDRYLDYSSHHEIKVSAASRPSYSVQPTYLALVKVKHARLVTLRKH